MCRVSTTKQGVRARVVDGAAQLVAVLAVRKRVLGEEHPLTLTAAGNLALTYGQQGKHAEAETLQVAVLAARKRVLGEEHPNTLTSANNLAATYSKQGQVHRGGDAAGSGARGTEAGAGRRAPKHAHDRRQPCTHIEPAGQARRGGDAASSGARGTEAGAGRRAPELSATIYVFRYDISVKAKYDARVHLVRHFIGYIFFLRSLYSKFSSVRRPPSLNLVLSRHLSGSRRTTAAGPTSRTGGCYLSLSPGSSRASYGSRASRCAEDLAYT